MTDEGKIVHGDFKTKHPKAGEPAPEPEAKGGKASQGPRSAEAEAGYPQQAEKTLTRLTREGQGGRTDIMTVLSQTTHDIMAHPEKIQGIMIFTFWDEEIRGTSWAGKIVPEVACHALEKTALQFRLTDLADDLGTPEPEFSKDPP